MSEVKEFQPPKLALAITKKDYYEWLDKHGYAMRTNLPSSPISGFDIFAAYLNPANIGDFFKLPTALMIRPQCETNEDFLQMLPYVIMRIKSKDGVASDKFYAYMRPNKGTEKRLHDMYSVGFGGHIEEQPSKDRSFADVIIDCAIRELDEEVKTPLTREQLIESFSSAVVFHDTSNSVGSVHLCLALFVDVDEDQVGEPDPTEVINFQVTNRVKLEASRDSGTLKLEPWTNILLKNFPDNFRIIG